MIALEIVFWGVNGGLVLGAALSIWQSLGP